MAADTDGRQPSPEREHRTVSRIASILEAAAHTRDGVRLSTIADELDAPKSSVHGLLKGLVAVGYLTEQGGGYVIGPAVQMLVQAAEQPPLTGRARPVMSRLHRLFDETVILGTRAGDSILYLSSIESTQLVKYSPPINKRRPLLPTSMGKVYLAELPPRQLDRYLRRQVPEDTARAAYLEELEEIRGTGVAFNHAETVPGVFGAASGIRQAGRLVGCLTIAGPLERLQAQEKDIGTAVKSAARDVSDRLR